MRLQILWSALLLQLVLGLAATSDAEVLVLKDGSRLFLREAPRVEGQRLVFTTPQGVLSALPLAEVDLGATEAANRGAAAAASSAAAPARREPVLRLTDEDVGHLDSAGRPTIMLYTTSWCGWCRKTRALLGELGARYVERDVERDPEAGREADRLAGRNAGVPVIHFGATVLTGFSESKLHALVADWRKAEAAARAAEEASRRPAARTATPAPSPP